MSTVLELIEKIIEEHKVFVKGFETLDQVINDAQAMGGLEKAKDTFVPGRLVQKDGLDKMKEILHTVHTGLKAHFDREETAVLAAFGKHGTEAMHSAFRSLLLEHTDLRTRLDQCQNEVDELTSGKLSRHVWEPKAHDTRAYISHTRKLLQAHIAIEQELLSDLRRLLSRSVPTGQSDKV